MSNNSFANFVKVIRQQIREQAQQPQVQPQAQVQPVAQPQAQAEQAQPARPWDERAIIRSWVVPLTWDDIVMAAPEVAQVMRWATPEETAQTLHWAEIHRTPEAQRKFVALGYAKRWGTEQPPRFAFVVVDRATLWQYARALALTIPFHVMPYPLVRLHGVFPNFCVLASSYSEDAWVVAPNEPVLHARVQRDGSIRVLDRRHAVSAHTARVGAHSDKYHLASLLLQGREVGVRAANDDVKAKLAWDIVVCAARELGIYAGLITERKGRDDDPLPPEIVERLREVLK